MLRLLVVAALALLGAQFDSTAHASTVQYDLTLTPTTGSIGGSGYLDVTAPANSSGVDTLTMTALSITIDGEQFSLTNEVGSATVTFSNGVLSGLNYMGALLNGFNLDILGTGGLTYTFLDIGTGATLATGTISDPPGVTPLPSAVMLFATGLLGLLLLSYRRRASAGCKMA